MANILVTGAAGFIGSAVSERLVGEGHVVYGCDNLNDYYDPALKKARLQRVSSSKNGSNFHFSKLDIADMPELSQLFNEAKPEYVVHLAAQAGVRYSLENPASYVHSNINGHVNILECCRKMMESGEGILQHLVYASSSSVYGNNDKVPFEEDDAVDHPASLYAASKRSDELMSYTYAHLFGLPSSGLRFFTVYGPWGRPDMSPMLFAKNILSGKPIKVFNHGDLWRDFTYIDDIVEGVVRLMLHPAKDGQNGKPHEVYNIGNSQPVQLLEYIKTMESALGSKANLDLQPWPKTEVYKTYASTEKLKRAVGYQPNTTLLEGLSKFAEWFKQY